MDSIGYRISDLRTVLGVGRTTAYKLIRDRELTHFKVGSRTLVTRASVQEYVARCLAQSAGGQL